MQEKMITVEITDGSVWGHSTMSARDYVESILAPSLTSKVEPPLQKAKDDRNRKQKRETILRLRKSRKAKAI